MLIVGDVHSYVNEFNQLVENTDKEILQVGDLLIGLNDSWQNLSTKNNWKFIRGNHDNPELCYKHPNYAGDWGYLPKQNLFYISGACSPDYRHRTENVDWWPTEQLSHKAFSHIIEVYRNMKPRFVVTHEAPKSVAKEIGYGNSSVTQHMFELMTHIHKPQFWYYGHYHRKFDYIYNGIQFHCIPLLGVVDIGPLLT